MNASSELIAGHRVPDRQREEAKANGQHDDVQHFGAPCGARCAAYSKHPPGCRGIDANQLPEQWDAFAQ